MKRGDRVEITIMQGGKSKVVKGVIKDELANNHWVLIKWEDPNICEIQHRDNVDIIQDELNERYEEV